jgi:hypothetical protein
MFRVEDYPYSYFYSLDRGSCLLGNGCKHLQDYTVSHPQNDNFQCEYFFPLPTRRGHAVA